MKHLIILIIASFLSCQNNNILNLQGPNQQNDSFSFEEIKLISNYLSLMEYFKPLNETKIKNMIEEFSKRYSPINNQFELILKINEAFNIFNILDRSIYCYKERTEYITKIKKETMKGFNLLGLKPMIETIKKTILYILASDLPLSIKNTLNIKKRSNFLLCNFCEQTSCNAALCLKAYWNDEGWDDEEYPIDLKSDKAISLLSKFISNTKKHIVYGFSGHQKYSNYSIPISVNKLILEYYSIPYNFFFNEELIKQIFYEMKSINFNQKTNDIYLEYFKLDFPFKESNKNSCSNFPCSLPPLIIPYYNLHPLFDLPFELVEKILNSKHKNLIHALQPILNYSVYADGGDISTGYYFSLLEKTNFLWDEWVNELKTQKYSSDGDLWLAVSENKLLQLIRISLVYGLNELFSNVIYGINNLHSIPGCDYHYRLENIIEMKLEPCLKLDKDKIIKCPELASSHKAIENILINNSDIDIVAEILRIFNEQINVNNPQ